MSRRLDVTCPFCWARHSIVSSVDNIKPAKGDYLICAKCGQIAVYDGIARKPSMSEKVDMRTDKSLQSLRDFWLASLATMGTQ